MTILRRRNRVVTHTIMAAVTLLSLFPFYWMMIIASNSTAAVSAFPPAIVPGANLFANIGRVLERIDFWGALFNSIFVTSIITLGVLFFCSLAGFAFAKLNFPGSKWLFLLLLGTMMVPSQLGLIPSYMIVSWLGWINSFKAIIVPSLVNAFGVFWLRQYITGAVHNEMLESGKIDGCSYFRLYWSLVLPIILPALATLGILNFMNTWNDFMWPMVILKDSSKFTIQLALNNLNDMYVQDYSLVMTGTFLATLPLMIVFFLFSRQFISGLTAGSVKS